VVVQIRVGRVTGASVTLGIESQDNGNKYQDVEISISRHSPRSEVISDHPEASQGDLEINQFCESWQKSR